MTRRIMGFTAERLRSILPGIRSARTHRNYRNRAALNNASNWNTPEFLWLLNARATAMIHFLGKEERELRVFSVCPGTRVLLNGGSHVGALRADGPLAAARIAWSVSAVDGRPGSLSLRLCVSNSDRSTVLDVHTLDLWVHELVARQVEAAAGMPAGVGGVVASFLVKPEPVQ